MLWVVVTGSSLSMWRRHGQTDRRIRGSLSWNSLKDPRSLLSFFFGMAFFVILAACGGGSGGGGGSPTASSISGTYSGGTTLTYWHLPGLIDSVYASSSYAPTTFTVLLEAGDEFAITDDQGNQGSGTFTLSGGAITLTGTLYINNCTPSGSTICNYVIKSGTGGLSIGSGTLSGTIDLYTSASSTTPYASATIGIKSGNFKSVALTALEGKSYSISYIAGGSNPYDCSSATMAYGSIPVTINGATVELPCATSNGYPTTTTNNGTQWPTGSLTYTFSFCPSFGSCTFPTGNPSVTVPSGSLGFYGSCPVSGSGICDSNNADNIVGYITPTSGNGGGVIGQMVVPAVSITFSGPDTCSMPEYKGVVSILDSSSGTTTGSYLFGVVIPQSPTYQCTSGTYYPSPIGFTAFSSTQY